MEISLETKEVKLLIALAKRHHTSLAYKLEQQMKEELLFEQAAREMQVSEYHDRELFLSWHKKLCDNISCLNPHWIRWRFIGEKRGHLEPIIRRKDND